MSNSSWYRRSLWNYKGNREYTRSGYEAAATRFNEKDLDVDCSDRHYLITGSNSGIGLEIAMEVARRGGIIHMVCRNQEAAQKARSEIITTTGNDKIHLHIVDLAKPREVVSWAERFAAQHERLHVLVHNAGCMVHERRLDEDGVEANFAVNTLAVHVITLTLMPLLERSDDSRVILVSSAGMLCVRLEPHDLMHANMEPFDGRLVYSQNKRQQVVMALWYAQRYNKVHFASMHPGWADTPAVRTSLPQFYEMMKNNLRTPSQGADTAVWLAISKAALVHPSGLFFQDREPVSTHLPLAWTKSAIEEEDFLMTNIQDVYTRVHSNMFPKTTTAQGTTETSLSTSQSAAPAAQMSTSEGGSSKATEETGVKETSLTEDPSKTEPKPAEIPVLPPPPAEIPVLPPPPAPASKVPSSKSEVQEVAEIHAPPASSRKNEDTAAETKEEAKVSPPQEEKKTDAVEEKRTEVPKEAPKKENTEETKTEKLEAKIEKPEETTKDTPQETTKDTQEPKTEKVEEPKTEKVEEPKTEKVEEPKTEKVEEPKPEKAEEPKPEKVEETKPEKVEETKLEKPEETKPDKPEEKTDTPEAKMEEPSPSSPEKAEERTEASQDEGKGDASPPPPPPPTFLPEP